MDYLVSENTHSSYADLPQVLQLFLVSDTQHTIHELRKFVSRNPEHVFG